MGKWWNRERLDSLEMDLNYRITLLASRVKDLESRESICTPDTEEPEIFYKDFTRKDENVIEFLALLDKEMFRGGDRKEYRDAKERALIELGKEGK